MNTSFQLQLSRKHQRKESWFLVIVHTACNTDKNVDICIIYCACKKNIRSRELSKIWEQHFVSERKLCDFNTRLCKFYNYLYWHWCLCSIEWKKVVRSHDVSGAALNRNLYLQYLVGGIPLLPKSIRTFSPTWRYISTNVRIAASRT